MNARSLLALAEFVTWTSLAGSACEPGPPPPEPDAGPERPVFIGDPVAAAELELVYRSAAGETVALVDGGEIPLILPPQGGKVILVGVRAKNVTQQVQINAGLFDDCLDPPIVIGREGRPVRLIEEESGVGVPELPAELLNYANIPVCPSFASSRDGEGQPYRLELRLTEQLRPGEERPRTHVLTATVVPVCGEPEILDDCRCECDADFVLETSQPDQCPTIHDDDLPAGECPRL